MAELVVIGGGLAGSEAAWQAAQQGIRVTLYEMRPDRLTPAHRTGGSGLMALLSRWAWLTPRTGKRPWAVVQLRQDNLSGPASCALGRPLFRRADHGR